MQSGHLFTGAGLLLIVAVACTGACGDDDAESDFDGGSSDGGDQDSGDAQTAAPSDGGDEDGDVPLDVDGGACDNDDDCSDGLACTGTERCDMGQCKPGSIVVCPIEHRCEEPVGKCNCDVPDYDEDDVPAIVCLEPGSPIHGDCDDNDDDAFPGGREVCDPEGVDEDCNPSTISGPADEMPRDGDFDGDGFIDRQCLNYDENGGEIRGNDCKDRVRSINPEATEACDYIDNDCNDVVDEQHKIDGSESRIPFGLQEPFYPDVDRDNFADKTAEPIIECGQAQPQGWLPGTAAEDCDDLNATAHEGAPELCDDVDNDCDEIVDQLDEDYTPRRFVEGATVVCEDGDEEIGECTNGLLNCSGELEDGCKVDPTTLQNCGQCRRECAFACGGEDCDEIKSIAAGADHSCTLTTASNVACWGRAGKGQLGDDTLLSKSRASAVIGISGVTQLVSGGNTSCVIRGENNELHCWGDNSSSQLGNGDVGEQSSVAVPVRGAYYEPVLTDVVSVAVSAEHACAVLLTGELVCWGLESYGRLGNGDDGNSDWPIPTVAMNEEFFSVDNALAVAVGGRHGCVITVDATVACWGDNTYGQLGDPTFVEDHSNLVRDVPGIAGATAIAAGEYHTCVVADGSVLCWGLNDDLELGRPSDGNDGEPRAVEGLQDATSISASPRMTCAVDLASALWCWGANDFGMRGDEDPSDTAIPIKLGLDDVAVVSLGATHVCATTNDNVGYCWGRGFFGQLGDGTMSSENQSVPRFVVSRN